MESSNNSKTYNKKYFLYMVFILILVQFVDSYTTSFPTLVPSNIINEFLSGFTENIGASIFAFITGVASVGMYFCAFNTYLSDKFGRKLMLAITVFGMVLVAFLINFSVTIVDFAIYLFVLWFFTRSDLWMIFIGEEAPKEKRAFWTNIILVFGLTGAILAPILRSRVITNVASNWRPLTWIIIIVGIPLGLLILFTLKEPKVYSDMKENEQSKQRVIKMKENVKGVLNSANRKEIFAALIISFVLGVNSVFRNLVENVISSSPYLGGQQISLIMLFGVIAVYIAVFLIGIFADKFGRRPLLYFFSILIPIARIMFALVVNQPHFTFLLTSIFVGLSEFGYWGGWISISIVILELVTTDSRGTGAGLKSFAAAFGITMGFLLTSVVTFFSNLSIAFIILGLLTIVIAPLTYKFITETKRIDMRDIARLKG